jgi:hypothetical protein
VLELLRKYFGIADADDAATRREKVSAVLAALDPALNDATPLSVRLARHRRGRRSAGADGSPFMIASVIGGAASAMVGLMPR